MRCFIVVLGERIRVTSWPFLGPRAAYHAASLLWQIYCHKLHTQKQALDQALIGRLDNKLLRNLRTESGGNEYFTFE
jgi:hypothetical protein